ncbi:MAG: queuine/other tRNA-ribosyltransferase [Acidimicrobiia bacterium]|nr:queuine/other tRNA-ribosyltransferase [Acidimicrobiia bacterium]MCY4458152.1 tRNA-guanine transglycosylase DpdA [Acidimicrobiaceae bacterium]
MRFYFPDSHDQIDPSFDFLSEKRSMHRVKQRDDKYAHEIFRPPPYSGLLVSKPIVDGLPGVSGKYTIAQRNRLYREGVRRFFRLDQTDANLDIMGDCGAFAYVRETEPAYSVDEVIDFYEGCGFDSGVSVDHVIFGFDAELDNSTSQVPIEWQERQRLTLTLAESFLDRRDKRQCSFEPLGVAQAWSPRSYATAVQHLQEIGFKRIAMGGMVPLKTPEIQATLRTTKEFLKKDTQLHLLGVTRTAYAHEFAQYGVTSFDSTSPFMQAFKDDRDNYYTLDRSYVAVRVPQVDGNTRLRRLISAGKVDQQRARRLEKACLQKIRGLADGNTETTETLDAILQYSKLLGDKKDRTIQYSETLDARPWEECACVLCKNIGIDIILFRGSERNRRRGFHNLTVFAQRLERDLVISRLSNGKNI